MKETHIGQSTLRRAAEATARLQAAEAAAWRAWARPEPSDGALSPGRAQAAPFKRAGRPS